MYIAKSDMKHILSIIKGKLISYDGYIFKNIGAIISSNAINKTLKQHVISHTHCSYLLVKGIAIYYISK